jgi:hypothetical protein
MKQAKPRKAKAPVNVPMVFPHPFWERVLTMRDTKPQTFAIFSPGFKLSAATYEVQRDRRALQLAA